MGTVLKVGQRLVFDWPPADTRSGKEISLAFSKLSPTHVGRHDMLVPEEAVGHIIGASRFHLDDLKQKSGAEIVVCTSDRVGARMGVPDTLPGCSPEDKVVLVVLLGEEPSIRKAVSFIDSIVRHRSSESEVLRVASLAKRMLESPVGAVFNVDITAVAEAAVAAMPAVAKVRTILASGAS